MIISKKWGLLIILLVLLFGAGSVFAAEGDGTFNETASYYVDDYQIESDNILKSNDVDSIYNEESDEIEVENWDDIQYYSSLNDKNYVLKLKENTNYYPINPESTDSQVIFNNNVTIIGAEGAYIGDSSPNPRNITYVAMKVPENSGVGITLKNITFKWIGTKYQPDGVFCVMEGNAVNYIENCYFTNISTNLGHSSILHIKLGDAVVNNCTFINCTSDFGCLSVYNPKDDPTKTCVLARMNVTDSYFEGNYARTEPGCINNCGILVVRNSTFYKNSAFWWAGAIHTHGGANTTLYDCNFTDNVAGWNGGALYTYSYLQIYNTIFIGNNCTTNNGGGAIGACKYLHAPYITIRDSLFEDNENTCWGIDELSDGTGRGGAISLMDEGLLDVRNTTFIKNSASMGTAICAINGGLQMGSPDVIIIGNRFINHTRVGDVLDVRLATGSYLEIRDNYYYNNSFEFKKLRLLADEKIGDDVIVHIDAELKNPDSFESDILDTTPYDIYVDEVYNKTVIGRTFSLKLEDGETCHVYAVPSISNSVTNEILVGIPKEYIYVSQNSGLDSNDGLNRTTPVKTIAKAIELARTKGNIIIMDGTFSESNFTIDYNLSIIGENNVKFSGNVPLEVQTIFTVTNVDLSLQGITFDNLVFTASNTYKTKRVILQDGGYLTIEDCIFNMISPNGNTGMNLIEATNLEIYNSNFTYNNKASVYITAIKADEFLVDNCTFTNNIASHSSYASLIATKGSKTGVKGTISNSIFENNKVKYGCVYFSSSGKAITITNTKFIANTVGGTSDHSSCIKIEESSTLRVDECVFKDNVNVGSRAAVIYAAGSSSSVFVSNSIIVNNSYANNNNAVFSASTANNLKCYKNLNGNWWGNTLENYDVAPAVYESACNNWIVLNMTANATDLAYNQKALVIIDLYNAIDRQGNSSFVDASKLPSFDLDVVAINGTASTSKINVVKGSATVEYTLKSYDSGSLTVSYAGVESTIDFAWSLVDPEIEIDVENNTYGNPVDINFTVPSDVDASKFSLKINNTTYSFGNAISIPNLNAGEYLINLTYSGDAKYNPYTITKLFKIEKATPQLTIDVSDVYYPNSAQITVNAGDATGEISIRVGDRTDLKSISSGKAEFIISNLQANNYTVEATYSGDGNYVAGNASADFKVKKNNSTITISHSEIVVGSDVTLTFNVKSDASGTITVDINGVKENVTISGGSATYTIRSISRGLYTVVATYNGDAKYLSSQNTTQLDVARLNATLNVAVSDITYGEDAAFTITLDNDASGTVTVIVDGINETVNVNAGKASLNISGLNAGNNKQASILYSGDNNYEPKETSKTFNVAKAQPTITIDVVDIKEGQVSNVQITITRGTTGTIELVTPSGTENPNVPRTGLFTRTFSDLAVGQYTISANYGGDINYLAAFESKAFNVSAWDVPQWPNEGYDVKNTGKSPYSSDANGNIAWIKDIDGTVIGNMAIDGVGNVYITTSNGIYSINANDGSTNWIFNSQDAGNNFSGIAISRDVILAPKSLDKLYFINQTTGEKYNNNIYQGSSVFAPIVDDEGNIYTSGEFYQFELTKVNIIPYRIWQTSTAPTSIEIGDYNITSSPVLVNDNTAILTTATVLIGVDLSSESVVFITPVVTNTRPVVGPGNSIYLISDGHMLSYNVEGTKIKDIKITGDAGDYISVGEYGEIYSINNEGKLFDYSADEETLIYDFEEAISSRLLVGQDGMLYVGSESGMLYAIDTDGNLLWKVNLNQSIANAPIMDSKGVIYVISGNRLIAIDEAQLKDSDLTAEINNVTYGNNVTVNIELDEFATGIVSIRIADKYMNESANSNGKISFVVPGLPGGNYTAEISYAGDGRFNAEQINVKFSVDKIDPTMNVDFHNIKANETLQINVTDLPSDATGIVTVSINDKSNSSNVLNGKATLTLSGLAKGEYPFNVTYIGDVNYNEKIISKTVSVGYAETSFNATSNDVNAGDDVEITVTGLPTDADGVVYVNHDGIIYSDSVIAGNAKITIHNLPEGAYDFDVMYANSTKYSANQKRVHVVVSKITPTFTVGVNDVNVTESIVVDVSGLPGDATGLVIASVAGLSGNASVGNGQVRIIIPQNLTAGSYTVNVTYVGDDRYNKISEVKTIEISKITPEFTIALTDSIYVWDDIAVDVSGLPLDATGKINVSINGISNSSDIENGISNVVIHQRLVNGTYPVEIAYSGNYKYNSINETMSVNISKATAKMIVNVDDEINVGENLIIDISGLPKDSVEKYVYILGDITSRGSIADGASQLVISNLTSGKYSFIVDFRGDDKYDGVKFNQIVNVNKLSAKMEVTVKNINVSEDLIVQIKLPVDIDDEYVYLSINDELYSEKIENGNAVFNVSGLTKGTYPYTISFNGNEMYDAVSYENIVDVDKLTIDFNANINNVSYGQAAVVEVSGLPNDASGSVIVIVDNVQYTSNASNGRASVNIPDLYPEQYVAEVRYSDDNYMADSKFISFSVSKINPSCSIAAEDIQVGDELQINVTLPNDATGYVTVSIGNMSQKVKLNNGLATVEVSGLTAGKKTIDVDYEGDKVYNSLSSTKSITVSKVDPTIEISADSIRYGEDLIVRVTLPSYATGDVIVNVGGKSQSVKLNRGIAIANITGLNAGNKSIDVSYNGDDKYNSVSDSKSVVVGKATPIMSIEADNIQYGEALNVKVQLSEKINGNVIISVEGINKTVKAIGGVASTDISGLAGGSHVINAKFGGDSNYDAATASKTVSVSRIAPSIIITAGDISYGEDLEVAVKLNKDINGPVSVSVSGIQKTITVKDGVGSCTFSNLTAGNKIVNVKYDGDANYSPAQNSKNIAVSKIKTDIIISNNEIKYGQNLKVQIDLNKDATGNLIISIGDVSQIANIKNGSASVEFSNVGGGSNTINVKYDGDENYFNATESKTINVAKSESSMDISVDDIKYGENLTVTIQMNNQSTGNVVITVGDISKTVPIKDGIAKASITNLNAGNYSVEATYGGDANFNNASSKRNVEVKSVTPTMDVDVPSEIKAGESPEITLELPKDATGSVQVTLDGKVIDNVAVVNGTAKFTLDNINPGNHTVSVAYSGDGKYAPFSKNARINCKDKTKKGTEIIVVDKFSRVANDYSAGERGNLFYAVLQDIDGNPLANKTVQIAVNGPIYEVQTDQLGRAGLQINLAAANTYTYALFFGGDSEYSAASLASSKLILTKKPTSITASAKTFKAKAKTKTVSVTLKTIKSARDGKTYLKAGKKITLKVGGKTYTAKINKNGVAKFNIKLTKKGKYAAKISFAGDKTYKACSKSIKITIK